MTAEELKNVLDNHIHWIKEDCDGWEKMRADLRVANLCEADLRGASLCEADLCEADLRGASLCEADLRGADLRVANLCGANLRGANLYGANLCGADLYGANLCEANLCEADLRGADLRVANLCVANLCEADLRGANLCEASLCEANLCEADLRGADLRGADLRGADLCLPMACPSEGSFIAWKQCRGGVIAKLLIPESAKRSSATGRKCRASEAEVIALYAPGGKEVQSAFSFYSSSFQYVPGRKVVPTEPFNDDRWNECAPGIHFFITREEAEKY